MTRELATCGFIGLGAMGVAMAKFAHNGGIPVLGYDVDAVAVQRAMTSGIPVTDSLHDLAERVGVVFLVVVNDEQVRSVLLEGGLLRSLGPGCVVAICASIRPETSRDVAEHARRVGVDVLDVALIGGARGAEQGRMTLFCGGTDEALTACRPAMATFAVNICAVGSVGDAQIAKIANNILLWGCVRLDYEAQLLAKRLGLDPAILRGALANGTGANLALHEWGLHRPTWPVKDLDLALSLAQEVDASLPFTEKLRLVADDLLPPL